MSVYIDDSDFRLYLGDALEVLASLPAGSVDCVVTSPPYWGLRDYGTGAWAGGDPDCDHLQKVGGTGASTLGAASGGNDMSDAARDRSTTRSYVAYAGSCGKCGASRTDSQIGLEATPGEYVERMRAIFAGVRRVLVDQGTLWLNLGDTYTADRSCQTLKPKDLVGIPWRVAFALQDDGWWLRSDNIWHKPNAMPSSVTDRPTTTHEYVFLLTKSARYWYDQDSVRVPYSYDGRKQTKVKGGPGSLQHRDGERWPGLSRAHHDARKEASRGGDETEAMEVIEGGRNLRTVWTFPTANYPEAHFATFPEDLPELCIKAGCPEGGTVLDPFMGAGTTALVARKLGRRSIGIELSEESARLCERRLQQLSLFG